MLVKTTRFGEIEVKEEHVIGFPLGLPGFEGEKRFILIETEEGSPFFFLQSTQTPDLAFIVANPRTFFSDYELHISAETLALLEVEQEEEMSIFVMLSVPEDFRQTTANLLAPILINLKLNRGVQSIPQQSPYLTRHYIFSPDGGKQVQVG